MFEDKAIIPQVIYDEVHRGQDKLVEWLDWFKRDCVKKPNQQSVLAMKAVVQAHPKLLKASARLTAVCRTVTLHAFKPHEGLEVFALTGVTS